MRINGGLAKGIPLRVTKTNNLRPATDANRERLFSSLGHFIQEKSVLDLFAGTGSYGLEALSRGARRATFVEGDRKVFGDLKLNLANTAKSAKLNAGTVCLENRDVIEFLRHCHETFDLVFLDPPYREFARLGSIVLDLIKSRSLVGTDSLLIHESPPEEMKDFPGWSLIKTLGKEKRGSPSFRFYKLSQPELFQ